MEPVEHTVDGAVTTLWLNRPQVKNAYNLALLRALDEALAQAEQAPATRVVVIRGRGDSFCAGADVSLLDGEAAWSELARSVSQIFKRIASSRRQTEMNLP